MTSKLIRVIAFVVAAAACGKGKGDKIGVAECDAYEDKMAACAQKVGGSTGESIERMRKMMLEPWQKQVADGHEDGMAKVCTDAIRDMKKQVPQCEW